VKLKGKRIAVLLENQYEDKEFWIPWYRMKEEGAEVVSVGPEPVTYAGKSGIPAAAEKGIAEVSPSDFDAVIVPGGYAPDLMRRNRKMVDFVTEMDRAGKVVAAICHAGWMLVSADMLKGRRATSFFSIRDDMVNAGADWVDEEAVRDGNLITSRNPDDLPAFCRTIIAALSPSR
jgi:protease I